MLPTVQGSDSEPSGATVARVRKDVASEMGTINPERNFALLGATSPAISETSVDGDVVDE